MMLLVLNIDFVLHNIVVIVVVVVELRVRGRVRGGVEGAAGGQLQAPPFLLLLFKRDWFKNTYIEYKKI